jgi:16S rRNA processing protein RimM
MPLRIGNDAGSEFVREPAFLVLGKLRRAHGIRGEIALEVFTRMPELLGVNRVVYVGDSHLPYKIENTRWKQELLILKFVGIDDRTTASELTNLLIFTHTEQLPVLPDGDYYVHELIGLEVFDTDGRHLGILTEILETGANDVYLVKDAEGGEVLIAAVEEHIVEIDLDAGKMIVSPIEWYGEGR